ncbi:MAG: addiction module toxin, HicA family [Acidobacteria bacterium]|nr:addiction module toxin, HicA family [Acidobacteriota bacterium]
MPKLPRPSGAEMVRFLESQGFTILRIRGSHHFMARGEVCTTVAVHGRETLKIGTLRGILRDIDLSPNEFAKIWNS